MFSKLFNSETLEQKKLRIARICKRLEDKMYFYRKVKEHSLLKGQIVKVTLFTDDPKKNNTSKFYLVKKTFNYFRDVRAHSIYSEWLSSGRELDRYYGKELELIENNRNVEYDREVKLLDSFSCYNNYMKKFPI